MSEATTYVLMSLRPGPFGDIVAGVKKYEFRRRYVKVPTTAFIYVSGICKSVKAVIEFDSPIVAPCEQIASISEKLKPGSYESIVAYLGGKSGVAIPIKEVRLIKPVSLALLRCNFPGFVVPQSYYILNRKPSLLTFLLEQLSADPAQGG